MRDQSAMPRNVEIKAKVHDMANLRRLVSQLSDDPTGTCLKQHDTFFFSTKGGRLKLREVNSTAELIFYERPDAAGPKTSNYHVAHVSDPENLRQTLKLSNGIRGSVKKERWLYMIGQTRVHCDKVEGLGDFMELEVVLDDSDTPEQGMTIAHAIMKQLDIDNSDLITGAYMDMLEKAE
eukprot:m.1363239 g.1363239  ORF g.1363239 m.1363239 type:complete len:179 (+) comp24945_c1_seq1:165-701(+)